MPFNGRLGNLDFSRLVSTGAAIKVLGGVYAKQILLVCS